MSNFRSAKNVNPVVMFVMGSCSFCKGTHVIRVPHTLKYDAKYFLQN